MQDFLKIQFNIQNINFKNNRNIIYFQYLILPANDNPP